MQRSCWRGYPGILAALIDALYLWKIPWLSLVKHSEYTPDELREIRDVDHLLGACMLIPRAVWNKVGPLDEGYFLFLEETEWCQRAQKLGLRRVYYPYASVVHYGQHSMRQQPIRNLPHLYHSYCRFYRQSRPGNWLGLIVVKLVIGLATLLRSLLWAFRYTYASQDNQRGVALSMLKGYQQVLRQLPTL